MDFRFAERVKPLNPSAIREILKYAADPEVVSLSAGNPAPEAFPIVKIAGISAKILSDRPIDALQYSTTEGFTPLREHVAAYMKTMHGIGRDFDQTLITAGAQQGAELLVKVLCNAGDVVVCESPSFTGSLNSFRSLGGRLVGVPMDSDGVNLDALEQALGANPSAKFIYTIPNFQNPSGITMSLAKRRAVYELAGRYDVVILEDNPYGDLRYEGESLPSIKSMDDDGRVLYCGSFSKVIAPGLRVGYAIGPAPLVQKMVVCKQGEDVHTAMWPQMVCDAFLTSEGYEDHLAYLRELYSHKAALMLSLLDEHLVPAGITYERAQGGLFIWCRLPDTTAGGQPVDMPRFCTEAVRDHKVAVVPGTAFLPEGGMCQNFRVNFSTPTDEDMVRGVRILGAFARDFLK